MTGLDTNILVRHFMQDDSSQVGQVAEITDSLSSAEPGWVGVAVVAELVWVLSGTYRLRKQAMIYVLDRLLASQDILVEQADAVRAAVLLYRNGNADFQDCLIAASAKAAGCSRVVTFDHISARDAGMELIA
jgi:predicted nucleic-acid-binding protein